MADADQYEPSEAFKKLLDDLPPLETSWLGKPIGTGLNLDGIKLNDLKIGTHASDKVLNRKD